MSNYSQESEDLDLESNERIAGWVETEKRVFAYQGDEKRSTVQEMIFHKPNDQTDALSLAHIPKLLNVSLPPSGTSTQPTPTKRTSEKDQTPETSQQSLLPTSPTTTSSLEDSLARLSALLAKEGDSAIHEALYSLRSLASHNITEPSIYFLRTSKDSSATKAEKHLRRSSERWMSWGMTANGRCLTARISASPKTGSGSSLSDILEENPDPKYFLSPQIAKRILSYQHSRHDITERKQTEAISVTRMGTKEERKSSSNNTEK